MLDFLVEFAKLMLGEQGEFFPFGAGMTHEGEMTSVGTNAGREHPTSRELIALLHSELVEQASAGAIKASGICLDVRIQPPVRTTRATPSASNWSTRQVRPCTCFSRT
jgi:hypothetical protein